MKRNFALLTVLALTLSISAFAQLLPDPNIMVGPIGSTCPTGCSTEPNLLGTTGFTLFSNGDPTADVPWYILLAIPEATDAAIPPAAPTITSSGFVISAGVDAGDMLQSTPSGTSIYDIAEAAGDTGGLTANGAGSLNPPNLFCGGNGVANPTIPCTTSSEITAFGSLPGAFEIYVYTVSSGLLTGKVNFDFTATLAAGTYVGGLGIGSNGQQPFNTPYTTSGVVTGSTSSSSSTGVSGTPGGPEVPEPASIVLLGTALLGAGLSLRKKFARS